ncbi:MAG: DUF6569 family protein [Thermoguttaceae bacterium]
MQRLVAAVLACALAGALGQSAVAKDPAAPRQQSGKPSAAQPDEAGIGDFVIGDPVRYKNLIVFPVASKAPRNEDRYLTLDEGLKAGTVQVFEVGAQPGAAGQPAAGPVADRPVGSRDQGPSTRTRAGAAVADPFAPPAVPERPAPGVNPPAAPPQQGQPSPVARTADSDPFGGGQQGNADVNHLMVLNRSDRPLYLMPGEIIYGGQQDRTIGVEAIIPPGKKPVSIEVFCVESGRWAAREETETSDALDRLAGSSGQPMDAKARQKLVEEAKQGKFVAHAGNLDKGGRAAVQEGKGQAEVWKKVGEANASSGAQSTSSAFTANYTNPQVLKQLEGYVEALQRPVANHRQVVGAIVAINGKAEAVDVFQSTPLFQKVWPKLLKSHALDAFDVAREPDAEKPCTLSDAREFLRTAMQAAVEKKSKSQGGLVVTKRDSEKVMSFSAGFGGMGGGFGDSVHSSGYKK